MRRTIILAALLALAGCGQAVPELARGLPAEYAEGAKIFDARLKARFPAGSDAGAMAETLRQQGFAVLVTAQGGSAQFSDNAVPVSNVWNIGWTANAGRVAEIRGIYGGRGP